MGFAALSDIRVVIAFWIGAISTLLTVIILLEVLRMRIWSMLRERHSRQFRETIQDFLIRYLAGEKPDAPKITSRDLPDFLFQWIHFQEILRGDSKLRLNQALHDFALEAKIRKLLRKGAFEDRLIAATALGHLGDRQAWDQLLILLNKPSPLLSITAARALIMIDSVKARDIVVPLIIRRRDWMPTRLALILKQADPVFQQAFLTDLDLYAQESPPYLPRLMRLVTALQLSQPLPFVRKFLMTSHDPNLLAASLRLVYHPSELDLVRGLFGNPHWSVQVQIAVVLGKIGMPQDAHYLLSLLNSKYWWVRYRAAQSLVQLPFINHRAVKHLIKSRTDVFAHNMLQHIVAEKERR
ncbi:MAG: HEAT repeat domain-containing protein [Methylococcaceae bacterium]